MSLRSYVRAAGRRLVGESAFASFRSVWWPLKLRWTAYEPETTVLPRLAPLGGTCIDVGGNFGQFSSYLSRTVGATGRVFMFEPLQYNREIARRVLHRLGCDNVAILPFAAGGARASTSVVVDALNTAEAHVADRGGEAVEMVDLDTWAHSAGVDDLDIVKIDVEGYELPVLEGARRLLTTFRPVIICEISGVSAERYGIDPQRVFDFLSRLNYVPHIVHRGQLIKHDGSVAALNYVFRVSEAR
jgi:FkbM family methyltransferase